MAPLKPPSLRHHKPTNQAYIWTSGRRVYLGRSGSPEALAKYHTLCAEILANGGRLPIAPEEITITELCNRYHDYCVVYFGGARASSVYRISGAVRPLVQLYGELPAASFGPSRLRTVRMTWVDKDLSITTINNYVGEIIAMFKWAVSNEFVPVETYQALRTLAGLRRGRGFGKDPQIRDVVPQEDIDAVLPRLSRQLQAIVRLQLLTAARPSELLNLRRRDIDATGDVWVAVLREHKTSHRGRDRRLFFGPRAQQVLKPFLLRPDDAHLFDPREAEAERYAKLNADAKSPRRANQLPNPRKTDREVGDHYDATDYARAVRRACDAIGIEAETARQMEENPDMSREEAAKEAAKAYRESKELQERHRWTPYRLRHTAATMVEATADMEVARALLGHSEVQTTRIYLHRDHQAAAAYALTHG